MLTLKYNDEKDRALGLGGMAVSLVMWENARYIQRLSLDAPVGEGVALTPDFFFQRNQRASAKAVWTRDVEMFQTEAGMLVANVASRAYIGRREPIDRETRELIVKALADSGSEACGLEEGEVRTVADKIIGYFSQVLAYPAVASIVGEFAEKLRQERSMERDRVVELLGRLERL